MNNKFIQIFQVLKFGSIQSTKKTSIEFDCFYSLTSYPPYNTLTTMQQNRPRVLPVTINFNKQFFAMVFFIFTFIGASYYAPEHLQLQPQTQQTK